MLPAKTKYTELELDLLKMNTILLVWLTWFKQQGVVVPNSDKLLQDIREYNQIITTSLVNNDPKWPDMVWEVMKSGHM